MKKDWGIYRDTGILGPCGEQSAVLRKAEGGVETLFRDTECHIERDGLVREREMIIQGKRFLVTSVFPGDGRAPHGEAAVLHRQRVGKRGTQRLKFQ